MNKNYWTWGRTRPFSRRKLLGGAGALGAGVLIAACGGGGKKNNAASSGVATPAAGASPTSAARAGVAATTAPNVQPSCSTPTDVMGFSTCADVEKAKKEGALVYYSPDVEDKMVAFLKEFHKLFPEIDTGQYQRDQTGRLYAKVTAERQAGIYTADVLALTDYGPALEFVKKKGFVNYVTPSIAAFRPDLRSDPPGLFTWYGILIAGMAYNTSKTSEADAPKSFKDLLDPKWKGAINFKDSASGLEPIQWYMLRKLYGDDFWKKMESQKPRGLSSVTQQYERLISGEDKIIGMAQYDVFLQNKGKGAPIAFVFPEEGVIVGPQLLGVVEKAPHPEAAKLFVDFFLSKAGETLYSQLNFTQTPRADVPAIGGGQPLSDMKIYIPEWPDIVATHDQWLKEWNQLIGLP
jgi:iron(III) transport system substrate-binding protein